MVDIILWQVREASLRGICPRLGLRGAVVSLPRADAWASQASHAWCIRHSRLLRCSLRMAAQDNPSEGVEVQP